LSGGAVLAAAGPRWLPPPAKITNEGAAGGRILSGITNQGGPGGSQANLRNTKKTTPKTGAGAEISSECEGKGTGGEGEGNRNHGAGLGTGAQRGMRQSIKKKNVGGKGGTRKGPTGLNRKGLLGRETLRKRGGVFRPTGGDYPGRRKTFRGRGKGKKKKTRTLQGGGLGGVFGTGTGVRALPVPGLVQKKLTFAAERGGGLEKNRDLRVQKQQEIRRKGGGCRLGPQMGHRGLGGLGWPVVFRGAEKGGRGAGFTLRCWEHLG